LERDHRFPDVVVVDASHSGGVRDSRRPDHDILVQRSHDGAHHPALHAPAAATGSTLIGRRSHGRRDHKPSGSAKTTVCSPRKHTNHTAAASAAAVPCLLLTHPLLALLHVVDPLLYPLLAALETLLAPLDLLLDAPGRRQAETDLLERLVHPLEGRLAVAAVLVTGGL